MIARILLAFLKSRVEKRRPPQFTLSVMDRVQRILLVTTTAIGDTMFSTPAIRAVKETYPKKKVHVLCHIRNQCLLEKNPYVDWLFLYRGKARKIISLIRQLKKQQYDLVVILHGNDPESIPLAWFAGARYLIGSGKSPFAFALSCRVVCTDSSRHAIEQRLDLVRVIGAETENKKMDLLLAPEWEVEAEQILQRQFPLSFHPLIGLHPTGSGSYKWWPAEYFIELAQKLVNTFQARIIILSSPGAEAKVARSIGGLLQGRVLQVSGGFDLGVVAALIKKCNLFIGNDSGPMHMALALGVPVLALIGADSPLRIGPYRVKNAIPLYHKEEVCHQSHCLNQRCKDNRCLKAILPEQVFEIVVKNFSNFLEPEPPLPLGRGQGGRTQEKGGT